MSQLFSKRQLWRRMQCRRNQQKNPSPLPIQHEITEIPFKQQVEGTNLYYDSMKARIEEKLNDEPYHRKKSRRVTFSPIVQVYRIPSLLDVTLATTTEAINTATELKEPNDPPKLDELYWSSHDYDHFKTDAILEIRTYLKLFGKSVTISKDPTKILYQPSTNTDDCLQNDFIYELVNLSKNANSPRYYSSVSTALATVFDCPDLKEKLLTSSILNTSFIKHVDTLHRLEGIANAEKEIYAIPATESNKNSSVQSFPYSGVDEDYETEQEDDSTDEEDDCDTVSTKDSQSSLPTVDPVPVYPSSLILG